MAISCVTQETQAPQAPAAPLQGGGGKSTALSRLTSHMNRSKVDVERMERKMFRSQARRPEVGWGGLGAGGKGGAKISKRGQNI